MVSGLRLGVMRRFSLLSLGALLVGCEPAPDPLGRCLDQADCPAAAVCTPDGRCVAWADTPCGNQPCRVPGSCALTAHWEAICLCPEGRHPEGLDCPVNDPAAPCAGVACSGQGACAVWYASSPYCVCEPGTHALGLHCVPNDPLEPCLGLPCDGHGGTCEVDSGEPACLCAPEDEALGQYCLPTGAPVWSAQAALTSLGYGGELQLTWDASALEARLFVGSAIQIFAWRQQRWVALTWSGNPLPRRSYAVAYDAARHRQVLFGGVDDSPYGAGLLDETWELAGEQWTRASPAQSPPARREALIGYDPVAERVVIFGGYDGYVWLSDTWAYDGTTWTEVTSATAPPTGPGRRLEWNPSRRRLTMREYQDFNALDRPLVTWELAEDQWVRRELGDGTPVPYVWQMAYHPVRDRWILLGQRDGGSQTWVGHDAQLHRDSTAWDPPSSWAEALVWVPTEEVLLLVGAEEQIVESWTYGWERFWAPEACTNGVDDDHDGAVDCEDPECEGQPCAVGICLHGTCAAAP